MAARARRQFLGDLGRDGEPASQDPRRQIKAAFALLAKHVADPKAAAAPWRMRRWKLPRKITPREK